MRKHVGEGEGRSTIDFLVLPSFPLESKLLHSSRRRVKDKNYDWVGPTSKTRGGVVGEEEVGGEIEARFSSALGEAKRRLLNRIDGKVAGRG